MRRRFVVGAESEKVLGIAVEISAVELLIAFASPQAFAVGFEALLFAVPIAIAVAGTVAVAAGPRRPAVVRAVVEIVFVAVVDEVENLA